MIATELSSLEWRIIACCKVQVLLKVHAILLQLADEVISLQGVAHNALKLCMRQALLTTVLLTTAARALQHAVEVRVCKRAREGERTCLETVMSSMLYPPY